MNFPNESQQNGMTREQRNDIRNQVLLDELREDGEIYDGIDQLDRPALDAWIANKRDEKRKKKVHTSL